MIAASEPNRSSRWRRVVPVLIFLFRLLFSAMLILFVLSIWAWLASDEEAAQLTFVQSFRPAMVPLVVIISLTNLAAVAWCWLRVRRRQDSGNRKWDWAYLRRSAKGIAKFVAFEWFILNATAMIVSLSNFGLPRIQYSRNVTFGVTLVFAVFHYVLFVRWFQNRRPFLYWSFKDVLLVMFPAALVVIGAFVVVLVNYLRFPLVRIVRTWFFLVVASLLIVFFLVPFAVYKGIVLPRQRAAMRRRMPSGPPRTVMEAAIRKFCRSSRVRNRRSLKTLMLVGGGIDVVDGLRPSPFLKRLFLSCNKISNLEPLSALQQLDTLHIDDNDLSSYEDLIPLRKCRALRRVELHNNPLCARQDFDAMRVVALLPQVRFLNLSAVSPDIRARADNLFGAWARSLVCREEGSAVRDAVIRKADNSMLHDLLWVRARASARPLLKRGSLGMTVLSPRQVVKSLLDPTEPTGGLGPASPGFKDETHPGQDDDSHAEMAGSVVLSAFGGGIYGQGVVVDGTHTRSDGAGSVSYGYARSHPSLVPKRGNLPAFPVSQQGGGQAKAKRQDSAKRAGSSHLLPPLGSVGIQNNGGGGRASGGGGRRSTVSVDHSKGSQIEAVRASSEDDGSMGFSLRDEEEQDSATFVNDARSGSPFEVSEIILSDDDFETCE